MSEKSTVLPDSLSSSPQLGPALPKNNPKSLNETISFLKTRQSLSGHLLTPKTTTTVSPSSSNWLLLTISTNFSNCLLFFKKFPVPVFELATSRYRDECSTSVQWGSVSHQMAVPVPSISYCVLNHHNLFYQIQNALDFNRDTCCHLALCLQLLPLHSFTRAQSYNTFMSVICEFS
jgi:hypothetical protein